MEHHDPKTSAGDVNFANSLNEHGYTFCNRVQREAELAITSLKSSWTLEDNEHPVEVREFNTRIDFILTSEDHDTWLVCECKRVWPGYADWFFAKNTYEKRGHRGDRYIVEYSHAVATFESTGVSVSCMSPDLFYHIAIPIKTTPMKMDKLMAGKMECDTRKQGRDAIEDASMQISKGVNGLVTYFTKNYHVLGPRSKRILIPVIFTTARLFVSDVDLTESVLATGKILADKLQVKEVPYLYYQYHLTPSIKHEFKPIRVYTKLRYVLEAEYIRTIAVVNAAHVQKFLSIHSPSALSSVEYIKEN